MRKITINLNLPAPQGRCYIALGFGCWGWGNTPQDAMMRARRNLPLMLREVTTTCRVYQCGASTKVEEDGSLTWPIAEAPPIWYWEARWTPDSHA